MRVLIPYKSLYCYGSHANSSKWALRLFLLVLLVLVPVPDASADVYQYVDEKGRVHLTNDEDNIPPQYLQSARMIEGKELSSQMFSGKEDEKQDNVGQVKDDIFSGQREAIWLKYKQMNWFDKKSLVARVGLTDMKVVLDDIKFQLAAITALFIGLGVFAIFKLKKASYFMPIIMLLLFCYGQVYLAFHIKSTMGKGADILSNLNQTPKLPFAQPVESVSTANSEQALLTNKGGLMGGLKELKSLSAERQEIFRMILEEDNI